MNAEIFDTLPDAVSCAVRLQLANPSETITIEEVSENCPICRPKVVWRTKSKEKDICKPASSQGDGRSYCGIGARFLGSIHIHVPMYAAGIRAILARTTFWRGTGSPTPGPL